jgi:general secretion pathway protein A
VRPEFFELKRGPFEDEPDYDLSYFSEQHGRAVNLMGHALWNRACLVTIFGEPGIGKTVLLQRFVRGLRSVTGLVQLNAEIPNFRERIARELQEYFSVDATLASDQDIEKACKGFLKEGRCLTLLVDDADKLSPEQLLELHWLGAMEENGFPAVNFILLGGPGLEPMLDSNLHAVAGPRQWHRFFIRRMGEEETGYYIERRLRMAGAAVSKDIFTPTALHLVFRYTSGIPMAINRLCRAAMECAEKRHMLFVSDREVALAIELLDMELDPLQLEHPTRRQTDHLAANVRSRARLEHSTDGELVEEIPLDRHRILLGRDLGNDVVISAPSASRYHAVIFSDAHGLLLVDLHSTNGTMVNGKLVTKHRLRRNDVITVGPHRLRYVNDAERDFDDDREEPGRETAVLPRDRDQLLSRMG